MNGSSGSRDAELERALHADGELHAELFTAVGMGVAGRLSAVALEVLGRSDPRGLAVLR